MIIFGGDKNVLNSPKWPDWNRKLNHRKTVQVQTD